MNPHHPTTQLLPTTITPTPVAAPIAAHKAITTANLQPNSNGINATVNNNNVKTSPASTTTSPEKGSPATTTVVAGGGLAATDYLRHMTPPPSSFRSPHDLSPFFANGGGTGVGAAAAAALFRPAGGFASNLTPTAAHQHTSLTHATLASQLQTSK